MKIALFTPNLSRNCGGAETYALAMANLLAKNHTVVFYTLKSYDKKFQIKNIYQKYDSGEFETRYVNYIITGHRYIKEFGYLELYKMIDEIDQEFDLFINCTFGKLIGPKHIKSIHIIHFPDEPYSKVFGRILGCKLDKKYLESYDCLLCNSNFTKSHLRRIWGVEGGVLTPPISMNQLPKAKLSNKQNIILAVDRLVPDKKVKEMIQAFQRLKKEYSCSYKLVVVGNKDSRENNYYDEISKIVENDNIEIKSGVSFSELRNLYAKSKIFWHAKGFEVPDDRPFDMEHFGMTTVEAMANGCVPIVINKAGQKEIIDNGVNGYKWDTLDQLIEKSIELIKDERKLVSMQESAIDKSKDYLLPNFERKLNNYISGIMEEI